MNSTRLQYFDQMKGIAILLVVIGHVVQFGYGFNPSDVVNMLGVFHMPVFFYISGYLAYKSTTEVPVCKRLLQKSCQLLIPLAVVGTSYCILKDHNTLTWATTGFGGYWFLYSLAFLTIFFILFEQLAQKTTRWYVYVGLWILPYLIFIFLKIKHIEIGLGNFVPIENMVTYYRYYLIGWLCHKYSPMDKFLLENNILYALAFIAYILQWYFCTHHNILLIFLGGMGAIIVLQNWLNSHNAESRLLRILSYLGQNSLCIYVFHYFFIPDVSEVMHNFLQVENPFIWMLTFALFLTIPIIAASVLLGSIVRKNRYLKFFVLGKTK